MSRSQTDNGGTTHGQNEKILANQIDQKVTLLAFGNVPEELGVGLEGCCGFS